MRNDWGRAKRLFRQALQQDDHRVAALHGLGVVSLQEGMPLRAVVLLERAQMLLKPHTSQNPSLMEALVFALNTAQHKSAQKKEWELVLRLGQKIFGTAADPGPHSQQSRCSSFTDQSTKPGHGLVRKSS